MLCVYWGLFLQVFAPLQLDPRNVTLVVGATFQVSLCPTLACCTISIFCLLAVRLFRDPTMARINVNCALIEAVT